MWETSQNCQVMTCLLLIALPAVHPVRQDLSVAGLRKGLEGERSGLFMEQIRITKEMRERARRDGRADDPGRYLVWENVPGAFSSNGGKDFQAVLTEIVRIAEPNAPDVPLPEKGKWPKAGCLYDELANWSVAWRVHDAQHWGVPQRRKRISVLADFSGLTAPEIMFDPQYRRTAEDGKPIETFSDIGTGTRQQVQPLSKGLPRDSESGSEEREGTAGSVRDGVAATITATYGTKWNGNAGAYNGENFVIQKAISFQERAGKPGGGKGILIQNEHTGALSTLNNQSVFCLQGNGIDRADTARCNGKGWKEDVSYTLNTIDRPAVVALNDQGSSVMNVSTEATGALRAQEHGHKPIVFDGSRRHDYEPFGDVCETVQASYGTGGGNTPIVMEPTVYNGESITSPINKAEPQPGDPCHTLGTDGRNYVVEPICVEMTSTKNTVVEDGVSPTLTARMGTGGNQVNAVCMDVGFFQTHEDVAGTLLARQYKDPPITYQDKCESLMASGYQKNGTQEAANDMYVANNAVVRRLTPLECERLQGYPDGWTNIGEWTDSKGKKHKASDSPRYKALGNSIALPFWFWLLRRISAQYERPATLGSLFSGISGFDLCWTRCNGIGSVLWESEVEGFCIAVSTKHFGDEEKGTEGDVAKYL